jgi:hypothetical protein
MLGDLTKVLPPCNYKNVTLMIPFTTALRRVRCAAGEKGHVVRRSRAIRGRSAMRLNRLAGAIVFFPFLAPQAMAASPELTALDLSRCIHFGKIVVCPQSQQPIAFSEEQFEALTKAPKLTEEQIQDFMKQNSKQIQDFVKKNPTN